MTYTLRFLPEVEDDAISGFSWYDTKSSGLGEDFLRMFYACAGDISRHPSCIETFTTNFGALCPEGSRTPSTSR